MKKWLPSAVYGAKPWVLIGVGAAFGLGMMFWSLWAGFWTVWRGIFCFAGVGLAIGGGAILQLRQDYRARSKWQREHSR